MTWTPARVGVCFVALLAVLVLWRLSAGSGDDGASAVFVPPKSTTTAVVDLAVPLVRADATVAADAATTTIAPPTSPAGQAASPSSTAAAPPTETPQPTTVRSEAQTSSTTTTTLATFDPPVSAPSDPVGRNPGVGGGVTSG